jgi:GMP synthase-like glutamine amidotransferase
MITATDPVTHSSTPAVRRIGVLICDEVAAPLAKIHGQYAQMFTRLLANTGQCFELIGYRVYADEFPSTVEACDAYLISGSRRAVYEALPWIERLAQFIRALHQARRRTVGICFGHQLIGRAMGGRAEQAPQGWGLGRQVAQVLENRPWMQPAAASYALYAVHQDQVTALPPGARRLATNAHCENAMFDLDDLFLGVQAHPEFDRDYARAITENKRGSVPDAVLEKALPSFAEPVDATLIARWIVAFLSADAEPRCALAKSAR